MEPGQPPPQLIIENPITVTTAISPKTLSTLFISNFSFSVLKPRKLAF